MAASPADASLSDATPVTVTVPIRTLPILYVTATNGDAHEFVKAGLFAEKLQPLDDFIIEHYKRFHVHLVPAHAMESRVLFAKTAGKLAQAGANVEALNITALGEDWVLSKDNVLTLPFVPVEAPPPSAPKRVRGPKAGGPDDTMRSLWRSMGLVTGHNGLPHDNLDNACRALESEKPAIWFDEFLKQSQFAIDCEPRQFLASDYTALAIWFQSDLAMPKMGLRTVTSAADLYMATHKRNIAQEWVRSLIWDNTARLDSLAVDGFGTPDDEFHRKSLKCFIMGMVLRILRPGAQVDLCPMFEGQQGLKKTSALRILGKGPHGQDWFAEYRGDLHNIIKFQELLRGKMLVNFSELAGILRVDRALMDGVVSEVKDTFRKAYGHDTQDYPRMCVLSGDTNPTEWNNSDVGARRYLPIECGVIDLDWIRDNRDQLFAEAAARLAQGESHWDIPVQDQQARVEARRAGDAWDESILRWCATRHDVTVDDIMSQCLSIELARATNADAKRIRSILRAAGWKPLVTTRDKRCVRLWQPPSYSDQRIAAIVAPAAFADDCPF